jgi:hypothetical protein
MQFLTNGHMKYRERAYTLSISLIFTLKIVFNHGDFIIIIIIIKNLLSGKVATLTF